MRGLGGRTYLDKAEVQIFFRCFHAVSSLFSTCFQPVSMFFHVFPMLFPCFSCRVHLEAEILARSEVKGGKEAQLGPDVELPAFTDRVYIGGKVRT